MIDGACRFSTTSESCTDGSNAQSTEASTDRHLYPSIATEYEEQGMLRLNRNFESEKSQQLALEERSSSIQENQSDCIIGPTESMELIPTANNAYLQRQIDNGKQERALLSEKSSNSLLELSSLRNELNRANEMCMEFEQDVVLRKNAYAEVEGNYERELAEKNRLLKERESLNHILQVRITQLVITNEELKGEREKSKSLSHSKAYSQSDLKLLQRKEDTLKKDISFSNLDKDDVQGKLWGIQAKVKSIEEEQAVDMAALKTRLGEVERERDVMTNLKFKALHANFGLETRLSELEITNKSLALQILKINEENLSNENNGKIQLEKLTRELNACRKEIDEIEVSREALRADREASDKKSSLSFQKLTESERSLFAALQEMDSIKLGFENAFATEAAKNANEIKELKKSLSLAQQTAADRETEVFGLKETIRRECEERVQNALLISELQDKIEMLERMKDLHDSSIIPSLPTSEESQFNSPTRSSSFPQVQHKPIIPLQSTQHVLQTVQPSHSTPRQHQHFLSLSNSGSQVQSQSHSLSQSLSSSPLINIQMSSQNRGNKHKLSTIISRDLDMDISLPLHSREFDDSSSSLSITENLINAENASWTSQMSRKPKTLKKIRKSLY